MFRGRRGYEIAALGSENTNHKQCKTLHGEARGCSEHLNGEKHLNWGEVNSDFFPPLNPGYVYTLEP